MTGRKWTLEERAHRTRMNRIGPRTPCPDPEDWGHPDSDAREEEREQSQPA